MQTHIDFSIWTHTDFSHTFIFCFYPDQNFEFLGFSGKKCEKLSSISFIADDSYIQMPQIDFQSQVNITMNMKTNSDSGVIFYVGADQHLAVELFRGRIGVSFFTGKSPLSTMYSYIFSYVTVNDDRLHTVELIVHHRNFTMRVDGGVSRSVVNMGESEYLDVKDDVYIGGLSSDKSAEAHKKFQIRSQTSFKGEYIIFLTFLIVGFHSEQFVNDLCTSKTIPCRLLPRSLCKWKTTGF